MVRELAELRPPVGVFFESECIFSLNDDSQMGIILSGYHGRGGVAYQKPKHGNITSYAAG